jgi:hypothetical protein
MTGPARYVAIIADGNGRWARSHRLAIVEGHRAGADTLKARLRAAVELGIEQLGTSKPRSPSSARVSAASALAEPRRDPLVGRAEPGRSQPRARALAFNPPPSC